MKRKMISTMSIAFILLLAACSNKEVPASGVAKQASSLDAAVKNVVADKKEVQISFWTGTGAANFPVLEEMVKAFQAQYPNIKVDFSNQGAIGDLTNKLTQNIVSKSTPTLSNLDATTFPQYISSGAIVDMMPFYNHETIGLANQKDAVFPYYLEEVKSYGPAGTMFGFPTNKKTTDVLAYNKTYFDKKGWSAPKTWDEVVNYSKIIKEETGKPGFSFDNAYGDAAFKLLSQQWGSPYIKADGTVDINNDASKEAMKFYKKNMDLGYFAMPAKLPSAGGGKYSNKGFVMEETYMFVGAAAGIPFAVPNPKSGHKEFEVGVAAVPQKNPAKPVYLSKGENYAIFSNSTDEQRVAAWLLIAFLSDAKQNAKWLISTGNLPVGQAMMNQQEYKQFLESKPGTPNYYKAAAVNAVLKAGDMSFNKVIPQSGTLAKVTGDMWEAVMIGGGDVDKLLQESSGKIK